MIVLARLLFTAITLYMFINLFLVNLTDRHNAIAYKIYLFLFIFVIQFVFSIFGALASSQKVEISEIVESSVSNAVLSVIAFDVYNDLVYDGFYKMYNNQQKTLMLVLLIISFMAVIKILQLLINQ